MSKKQSKRKEETARAKGEKKSYTEWAFTVFSFFCIWMGMIGIGYGYLGTFGIKIPVLPFCAGLFFICGLWSVLWWFPRQVKFTLPMVLILYFLIGYRMVPFIVSGFGKIANEVVAQINQYYQTAFIYTDVLSAGSREILICSLVLLFLPAGILSLGVWRWQSIGALVLLGAIPITLALSVGVVPPLSCILPLLFSLTGIKCIRSLKRKHHIRKKEIDMKTDLGTLHRVKNQTACATVIGLAALLAVSVLAEPFISEKLQFTRKWKQQVQDSNFEDIWQEMMARIPELDWDFLSGERVGSGGISGGKLGRADRMENKEGVQLKVTASEDIPGKVYLRAFIGSIYQKDLWKVLDETDVPKEIKMQGTQIQSQEYYVLLDYLNRLNNAVANQGLVRAKMTVENVAASRAYYYVPYFSDVTEIEADVFDATIKGGNKKKREYNFIYRDNFQSENRIALNLYPWYKNFVYDSYLQVPDDTAEVLGEMPKGLPLENAVEEVKTRLKNSAAYSQEPGATPKGEDFVSYFLQNQKKGFCMHFASAGTLMFRMMGIPARYVEGYTATGLKAYQAVEVPDSRAHAWVEIWVDEFGWYPVEVTPGFEGNSIPRQTDEKQDMTQPQELQPEIQETKAQEKEKNPLPQQTAKEDEAPKEAETVTFLLIWLGSVLILAATLLPLRREYIIKRRERRFHGSPDQAIGAILSELYRFKRFQEKPLDEGIEEYKWLLELAEEAKFSNHKIKEEDRAAAEKIYTETVQKGTEGLGRWKKFTFYYVYCF